MGMFCDYVRARKGQAEQPLSPLTLGPRAQWALVRTMAQLYDLVDEEVRRHFHWPCHFWPPFREDGRAEGGQGIRNKYGIDAAFEEYACDVMATLLLVPWPLPECPDDVLAETYQVEPEVIRLRRALSVLFGEAP